MSAISRYVLLVLFVLVNLVAFALMGVDKQRARTHQWRVRATARTIFRQKACPHPPVASAGKDIVSGGTAVRRYRRHDWHVLLSPQDQALVFPHFLSPAGNRPAGHLWLSDANIRLGGFLYGKQIFP